MKVLVCGQRDFADADYLYRAMNAMHAFYKFDCVVEGEARGADEMAREWGKFNNIRVAPYPANWKKYGKGAGPIRNREMLEKESPTLILAFYHNKNESKGTRDMVKAALGKDVPVIEFVTSSLVYVMIEPTKNLVTKYRNVYNVSVAEKWTEIDAVKQPLRVEEE